MVYLAVLDKESTKIKKLFNTIIIEVSLFKGEFMKMNKMALKAILGGFLLCTQLQAQLACNPCAPCNPYECGNQFFGSAEYLYWKIKDSPKTIPLVVTGPIVNSGSPVTDYDVVLGGRKIKNNWRSGGRFSLGYWFDDEQCYGAEVSYFFLPKGSKSSKVFSDGTVGSAFLAIPYVDVVTQTDSSEAISFPSGSPGGYSGFAKLNVSNNLQGAELNGLARFGNRCDSHFDLLVGFRYLYFGENLTFNTSSPYVAPFDNFSKPDIYKTKDRFKTENNFYGAQIGLAWETLFCNDFFFNVKAKVALGAVHQKLNIKGHLITNDFNGFDPNPVVVYEGGYFALPTNIGHHKKTKFAVLPEVNLNVGYQVMDCLRLQLGYSFLYLNHVMYASNQLDPRINPSQSNAIEYTPNAELVGEASPRARHKSISLWAQGLNIGLEYSF